METTDTTTIDTPDTIVPGNGSSPRGELEAALVADREARVKRAMAQISEALETEECALQGQALITDDGRIATRIAVVPR